MTIMALTRNAILPVDIRYVRTATVNVSVEDLDIEPRIIKVAQLDSPHPMIGATWTFEISTVANN
jgi:hypothetical protein